MDYLDSRATTEQLAAGDLDRSRWTRYLLVVLLAMVLRLELCQPRIFWMVLTQQTDPALLGIVALKVTGFAVLQLGGVWHFWRLNQDHDGRDFWFRYVTLSCPAGLLAVFLGMVVVPLVFYVRPDLTDPETQRSVPFVVMSVMAAVELFYFSRVRWSFRCLFAALNEASAAESLDPPESDD